VSLAHSFGTGLDIWANLTTTFLHGLKV